MEQQDVRFTRSIKHVVNVISNLLHASTFALSDRDIQSTESYSRHSEQCAPWMQLIHESLPNLRYMQLYNWDLNA